MRALKTNINIDMLELFTICIYTNVYISDFWLRKILSKRRLLSVIM